MRAPRDRHRGDRGRHVHAPRRDPLQRLPLLPEPWRGRAGAGQGRHDALPGLQHQDERPYSTSSIPPSPVTDDCQKHFVILLTDGEPLRDDFAQLRRHQREHLPEDNLIGDYLNPGDEVEDAAGLGLYLDDVAAYMQAVDFYPGTHLPEQADGGRLHRGLHDHPRGKRPVDADGGGGQRRVLLQQQRRRAGRCGGRGHQRHRRASPRPSPRHGTRQPRDGRQQLLPQLLHARGEDAFWEGHLKVFELNAAGEIRDDSRRKHPATPPTRRVVQLPGRAQAHAGFWDAANEMPVPASRNLYVSNYQTGPPVTSRRAAVLHRGRRHRDRPGRHRRRHSAATPASGTTPRGSRPPTT